MTLLKEAEAKRPEEEVVLRAKKQKVAFGGPGIPPRWNSSMKTGVGTAINAQSKVWYTLGEGILTEIYYPQVDQACTRDMEFIITDGKLFFSEEKRHTKHQVMHIAEGIPAYRVINTCLDGNYKIEKEIISDPMVDSIIQKVRFTPLRGKLSDYHLHALLTPHLGNYGTGNTAWVGDYKGITMLFAERDNVALAMACSLPWKNTSVGFVGFSDGWQDLKQNNIMTWKFQRAENGNVAITGEVDLKNTGENEFLILIGFGRNWAEAGQRIRSSLVNGFEKAKKNYISEWQEWHDSLFQISTFRKKSRDLYKISTSLLRTHESKRHPGGVIASLSIPWGFAKGDDDKGGYHLVWPRDVVHTATGMLAANAKEDAKRVLNYLRVTQEADGYWSQNMWLDGTSYWSAIQMDQAGCPVMLAGLAYRKGAVNREEMLEMWPMIKKAVSYIVTHGPATDQDRWEENAGYTPYTLAMEITALLVAADVADMAREKNIAAYLREIADAWNEKIEDWVYASNTKLSEKIGVDGYYIRIAPATMFEPQPSDAIFVQNKIPGEDIFPAREMVSPDALALVRFGLRKADDPKILNTVKAIDALLKVETPCGPSWHRYNEDGYGEHADGSPYDGIGIGRAWPLLTGERGHYELAAGNYNSAKQLLEAMVSFANEGGMIPEQIWDLEDIPEHRLYCGRPSGAAMPLVWAHSEYIKLCRSLKEKKIFDMPFQTEQRYLINPTPATHAIWNFNNKTRNIPRGRKLRIETLVPAMVKWTFDNWEHSNDENTRDSELGVHYVDLPCENLSPGERVIFTFYWVSSGNWENVNFHVQIG